MGENENLTVKSLKERIQELKKENYIKEGWLDDQIINDDIVNCINSCTSPTGDTVKERLKAIFRAFSLFPISETKVLILGQDPYPNPDKADGCAFSVGNGRRDASLSNIFKAIENYKKINKVKDFNRKAYSTDLKDWASNNKVLLLNTALTYQDLYPKKKKKELNNSEKQEQKKKQEDSIQLWEMFIYQIFTYLLNDSNRKELAVFLWGKYAQKTFLKYLSSNNELIPLLCKINDKFRIESIKKVNKDEYKFDDKNFKVVREKGFVDIDDKTRVFMTNHPSPPSENNKEYGKKFVEYSSKSHFQACDDFLDENIWLNFPENNQ